MNKTKIQMMMVHKISGNYQKVRPDNGNSLDSISTGENGKQQDQQLSGETRRGNKVIPA